MPIFTEEKIQSNPIPKLTVELRRRTYGMCDMCDIGVGPWGYGVNTLSCPSLIIYGQALSVAVIGYRMKNVGWCAGRLHG